MLVLIYKLYNENDCFIGSTDYPLHKRLSQHKSPHNRCCSRIVIEQGDYKIEEIDEVHPEERFKKEQEYINEFSTLNQIHVLVNFVIIITDSIFNLANVVVCIPTTTEHVISSHRNMLILYLNTNE